MRRPALREKTLAHLATALGVTLVALFLASGPFGMGPTGLPAAINSPGQAEAALAVDEGASPALVRPDASPPTSRGPRTAEMFALSAEMLGLDLPAPTSTATLAPRPSATPTDPAILQALPTPTAPTQPRSSPTPTAPTQPRSSPTPLATATLAPTLAPAPSPSPGPRLRVGLQAGHWKNAELPTELGFLRGSTGAAGKGWAEVDVNLNIARRVAARLEQAGLLVDLLPATVPPRYRADAFVALHGDANSNPSVSGYKLARSLWSSIPNRDETLIRALSEEYRAATGLADHPATITMNMRAYYAFDQRLQHSVSPATPAVILEMGFLTTASDRQLLLEQPDRAAEGIAKGVLRFLK